MQEILIPLTAFIAAILTFFSGFGLGTLLTPVMMLFFPVDTAIAMTGVVHFANNIFKFILVGKQANKEVLLRFGLPAIPAALLGSWVLFQLTDLQPLFSYSLLGNEFQVSPLKLVIALLLILFALADLLPWFTRLEFGRSLLPLGGVLSGFFGGLSGHQGALRSAFLIRAGLSKEAFIGTAVVISCLIDITRIGIYSANMPQLHLSEEKTLIILTILAAITGAFIGNKLLKKITLHFLQMGVAIMLLLISVALAVGWI